MYQHVFKRLLDIVIGVIALVPVCLVILIFGIAIKLEDGGPVFYNAPRIGKDGRDFIMYKLRSMRVNAPDLVMEDGSTYNGADDPRMTKVGALLRKTSLDELPQFLNVLKGDMSVIGPRPDLRRETELYTGEEGLKLTVKPGITGYAAVMGRNSLPWHNRLALDVYYVKHISFALDAKVFFRTFATVFKQEGIYVEGDDNAESAKVGKINKALTDGRTLKGSAQKRERSHMAEEQNPDSCNGSCGSCGSSSCGSRTEKQRTSTARANVKHVIGVVSGKGGVGKSLVTCLLASELTKRGYKVGVLDADITGPSIPKAFGLKGRLMGDKDGILPFETESGIKAVSTNLMLDQEDAPVAWRGPVVTGLLKQFFGDTNWEEIDYLLVDMPPGTSDVFLTVMQSMNLDGIVTVSAPQQLVSMIVGKAVNLAHEMNIPVLGLVENMAYFKCDECNKRHFIFGEPQGAEIAEHYGIPACATLPLDPSFAKLVDAGKVEEYDVEGALDPVIDQIVALPAKENATQA